MTNKKKTHGKNGDSCGCAMGAKFLAAGFIVSLAWYGWQWLVGSLSAGGACWRVALVSFAAAVAGKFVGIARFRMRGAGGRAKHAVARSESHA